MGGAGVRALMLPPVALAWASCAALAREDGPAPASARIEFVGEGGISAKLEGDRRRVGGLSGLAWRASDDRWFAVSDDKDEPRVYTLRVSLDAPSRAVTVTIEGVGSAARPPEDAEGIAIESGGSLLLGFERPFGVRRFRPEPATGPIARLLDPQAFEIPAHVRADGRINRGFESVATLERPGARREIWAGTESALESDGEEASPASGALCRIVVWDAETGAVMREHAHRTLPTPPSLPFLPRYNSLAELTPTGDGRLLALERSFSPRSGYDGRIRLITPGMGETDLGDRRASPLDDSITPLRAETVCSIVGLGATSSANFEGMALGPALPDGGRLLLLVADDNFGSDGQPINRALALRWLDGAPAEATRPSAPGP